MKAECLVIFFNFLVYMERSMNSSSLRSMLEVLIRIKSSPVCAQKLVFWAIWSKSLFLFLSCLGVINNINRLFCSESPWSLNSTASCSIRTTCYSMNWIPRCFLVVYVGISTASCSIETTCYSVNWIPQYFLVVYARISLFREVDHRRTWRHPGTTGLHKV